MSNTSDTTLKIQRALGYVWVFFVFFPAACVLFIFPLAPDYFEGMAIRANGLLGMIELGRSRPWIIFTGMPYPAVLRLLGDASGIAAALSTLIIVKTVPVVIFSTKNKKIRENLENLRKKTCASLNNKDWAKRFIAGFLQFR